MLKTIKKSVKPILMVSVTINCVLYILFGTPTALEAQNQSNFLVRVDSVSILRYDYSHLSYANRFLKKSPIELSQLPMKRIRVDGKLGNNSRNGVQFLQYCSENPDDPIELWKNESLMDDYETSSILTFDSSSKYLLPLNAFDPGYAGIDPSNFHCEKKTPYTHFAIKIIPGWQVDFTLLQRNISDPLLDKKQGISISNQRRYLPIYHFSTGIPVDDMGREDYIPLSKISNSITYLTNIKEIEVQLINADGKKVKFDTLWNSDTIAKVKHLLVNYSGIVNIEALALDKIKNSLPGARNKLYNYQTINVKTPFGIFSGADTKYRLDYFDGNKAGFLQLSQDSNLSVTTFILADRIEYGDFSEGKCNGFQRQGIAIYSVDSDNIPIAGTSPYFLIKSKVGVCSGNGSDVAYKMDINTDRGFIDIQPAKEQSKLQLFKTEIESDYRHYKNRYIRLLGSDNSYYIMPQIK